MITYGPEMRQISVGRRAEKKCTTEATTSIFIFYMGKMHGSFEHCRPDTEVKGFGVHDEKKYERTEWSLAKRERKSGF